MIVYKLTSPSNKSYIGLTGTTVTRRFDQHRTLWRRLKRQGVTDYRGHQCTSLLFFAFDKYDPYEVPSLWTHDVLFESDDADVIRSVEIASIHDEGSAAPGGYNVLLGGQMGHTGRKLSEEHKAKQIISAKKYWQSSDGQAHKIRLVRLMKLSNPSKGFTGPMSQEHKNKISIANSRKTRTTEQKAEHSIEMKRRWEEGSYNNRDLWTEDRKQKQKDALIGRKYNTEHRNAIADGVSQEWDVILPTGEKISVSNLRQFCKEHGLSQGNLSTYGKTKGYQAKKKAP